MLLFSFPHTAQHIEKTQYILKLRIPIISFLQESSQFLDLLNAVEGRNKFKKQLVGHVVLILG